MGIENITNLATPKNPSNFSFPVFGRAKEYRQSNAIALSHPQGFSINFDNEEEAKEFLSLMIELRHDNDNGKPIFEEFSAQSIVDEKKAKQLRDAAAAAAPAPAAAAIASPVAETGFTVNIECKMDDALEDRIRKSNLAKLIERQKAKKQASTAKTVVATAINVVALGGVPVAGYIAGYAGKALAEAEQKLGWFPVLGFALRNSSRFLLDSGAGILRHGKSPWSRPSASTNQKQASALEKLSDNVGKANHRGNVITDFLTFGAGVLAKAPAALANVAADGLNRVANDYLKTRKADESKSIFYLRRFAGQALKALAAPLRVPEIAANWLLDSAKNSMPGMRDKVGKFFQYAKIKEVSQQTNVVAPREVDVASSNAALKILGLKPGLVFNHEYSPDLIGGEKHYLAELTKCEVDGVTYKVFGSYDNPHEIFYKYSGIIDKSLPLNVVGAVNRKLSQEANVLVAAQQRGVPSSISVNGFKVEDGGEVKAELVKTALKAALGELEIKKGKDKKAAFNFEDEVNKGKNYSFKAGSQVLTYESGTFTFSAHGQNLDMGSREFFNFLGNLSRGGAEFKKYSDLPSTSVGSPQVVQLKRVNRQHNGGDGTGRGSI